MRIDQDRVRKIVFLVHFGMLYQDIKLLERELLDAYYEAALEVLVQERMR